MKLKLLLVTLIALFTLTACAGTANGTPPQPNTLSLNATGTAKGNPDIATATVGVMTRHEDPSRAVSENSGKMTAIMKALSELGIEAKDIHTTNFSIHAEQQFDRAGKITSVTYVATNNVSIIVRDLTKVGDVLGKAVSNGANNIHGVQFGISDPVKLEAQARDKAMANAKAKAEQMAKAAGVSIDKVMTLSESSYSRPPQPYALNAVSARAIDVESVPVSTGEFEVSVQVSVVYVIK